MKQLKKGLSLILCLILIFTMGVSDIGSFTSNAEAQTWTHLIINQVFGTANKGGAVSHSFVEIYNPTAEDISLD